MDEKIDFISDYTDFGIRLDVILARHLSVSRSFSARLIDEGRVVVDSSIRKPSFKVKNAMRIHGSYCKIDETAPLKACEIPLDVIYEDQWIIVINKPAGLTVHPGAGNADGTLVNALLDKYPQIKDVGDPNRPGIVHRLDKMTSGVMVVAANSNSHAILASAFKRHEHQRVYVAICYGHMPQTKGTIETFLQRNPRDRKKMTSRADKGRRAVTHWEVIKQWEGFSLLLLTLQTGRTHQIRVHLSDMGHPVVGDPQYGGRRRANSIEDPLLQSYIKALDRQMLHALTLGIKHPISNKQMEFKSDMPDDMNQVIRMLDERDSC